MEVEIKDGKLVITMPISPRTSKSGKSTVIASSGGNIRTMVEYEGKPIVVGINCYVSKD